MLHRPQKIWWEGNCLDGPRYVGSRISVLLQVDCDVCGAPDWHSLLNCLCGLAMSCRLLVKVPTIPDNRCNLSPCDKCGQCTRGHCSWGENGNPGPVAMDNLHQRNLYWSKWTGADGSVLRNGWKL